jgi:hypothetical protein
MNSIFNNQVKNLERIFLDSMPITNRASPIVNQIRAKQELNRFLQNLSNAEFNIGFLENEND